MGSGFILQIYRNFFIMRRTKQFSILFFVLGFCFCLFLIGTIRFLSSLNWTKYADFRDKELFYPVGQCPDCQVISTKYWNVSPLNDNNDIHLAYAQKFGVEPFLTNGDFDKRIKSYLLRGKLEKMEDNQLYKLKKLTHSYPYLVPEAVDLLNEVGRRFEGKLDQLNIGHYYMTISSVLRTKESQNGLGRRNSNATKISAHIYGTTFDISYKEFLPLHGKPAQEGFCRHDMMRHALAEVLSEMSAEGRCKVAREKKQACFHITVAK